ncbi:GAF domain-containing protein [Winogradskyella sp. J14-2]|uniref:GAF domain-containing protein n=1 Tax=Winogradskyella sp. J14-2 TaxID=1936080 RepID=UPI000972877B|nr:GAF domain-containing protein [Winogradskyella sp. J14-2]APY08038.1 GAF domain-containing protein [Winogradskyella sp. J14-2]
MDINQQIESPFILKVSFNKLLEKYEEFLESDNKAVVENAKQILEIANTNPVLKDGFSDLSVFEKQEENIAIILRDTFNPLLTHNEIKAAVVPFYDHVFSCSERLKTIIRNAGDNFRLKVMDTPIEQTYILACTIILKDCYGYDLNFKRPFLYEIPDVKGITRYYKILYNVDFMEILPRPNAPKITEKDYEELLDNFDNLELWKEKFPPNSYDFKGFVISNIFDVTDDQSISNIKSSLISENKRQDENFMQNFYEIFRSLFGFRNIEVGFSIYNEEDNAFERVNGAGIKSFLLNKEDKIVCEDALCSWSYKKLLEDNSYFSISDVDHFYNKSQGKSPHLSALHLQGFKSAILAPIANETGLMGVLEIVSKEPKLLNSINAIKLVDIMPYIVSAVERSKSEEENLIEAIIQKECTSIHPSVHWKFVQKAKTFIKTEYETGESPTFGKIVFENVYPLYGQVDVKGSSNARNEATQKDLSLQLNLAEKILTKAIKNRSLPIFEQIKFQVSEYYNSLKTDFKVDSEHEITVFLRDEVKPVFDLIAKTHSDLIEDVEDYLNKIDKDLSVIYFYRKHYDDTVKLINTNMSSLIDEKQLEAQAMYPHFFERFKTDGVEHNMYIGESITKQDSFNVIYLYNLRLWQLQVMCEMENYYYQNQHEYPISLDVASMVLVFNQPLSIRFRMDEKRFDVDGTYNARYEVVKKRVDKAFIKGTEERITEKGKLTIVYSQKEDEDEYKRYIGFLQSKNILDKDLEVLELEDLQGVTGLKALRVSILYHNKNDNKNFYTYNDLMDTIKS